MSPIHASGIVRWGTWSKATWASGATTSATSTFCASPMMKMRAPTEARPKRLPALVELSGDGLVADDRAGDELGEEGDVERDVDRIAIGAEAAAVDVDDVAQAVEGEERDAERQLDVRMAEVEAERLERARRNWR